MIQDLKLESNATIPLQDAIFETLRHAILKGELVPGERLMEIQLANCFCVSRTPIRGAIRRLEDEKLVLIKPRRGAKVAKIPKKDMRDILEVRCSLEMIAVKLACERSTDEKIINLKHLLDDSYRIICSNNIKKVVEIGEQFHDTIYAMTDNSQVIRLMNSLKEQVYRYRFEHVKKISDYMKIYEEHLALFRAIEKKDIVLAQKLIMSHINYEIDFA